jgi:transcriptional regulator GlxA family with amidase domain
VFSATRLNEEKRRAEPSPFEVSLIAETLSHVNTTGGMRVMPYYSFENCPPIDILVVPGGWGTRKELKNPVMLEWLRKQAAGVETLTSVCTGSMLPGFAALCPYRMRWLMKAVIINVLFIISTDDAEEESF